ncbi:hypothetical protein M3Y99_00189900 [Aphelenchoides fujianensis]|nr:hypothetical protein M3Y99_00189900 [Aphelenchoides fujianensis]
MDTRLARVCQGVLSLFSAIIISMFIDLPLTLVCSLLFILQGALQFFLARKVHKNNVRRAQSDESGRFAVEAIENWKTIQLLNAEDGVSGRFDSVSRQQMTFELWSSPLNAANFRFKPRSPSKQEAQRGGVTRCFRFTQAFCYSAGLFFVLSGWSAKIAVFQVVQTLYFGSTGILQAAEFFPEFVKSRLAAALMFKIINQQPRTGDPKAGEKVTLEGNVELENVFFAYPNQPKNAVLKGVNISVAKGRTVALVGSSGSGKSTVKVDGIDLRKINLHKLREQVALVEQMPRLMSGTIKENICYGLDPLTIPMERIIEAAKTANAAQFISTPAAGLRHATVGRSNASQSRRAIIREPRVLLLDEATSALDSESEKIVQEALEKARVGRTCITIAHRLSTVQNADLIVVLEDGRLRESGTHAQLLAQRGRYFNLIKRQDLTSSSKN